MAAPSGSSFSCRASAARVALSGGVPVIEPFVANGADAPCASDSANVLTPTAIGPLAVNAVNVSTSQTPAQIGAAPLVDGNNATASSTVTNPTLTLGTGTLVVHADVLGATAAYTCRNGVAVASSSGQVVGLTINGNAVTVPQGENQTVPLGPLGSLVLNQVDTSQPGVIVRRAVSLTTPLGTVVISEASADITGNPCAAAAPAPPPGTGPTPPSPPPPGTGPTPPSKNPPTVHRKAPTVHGKARLVVSPRATARMIARGACVRSSFLARVVGRRIARVVFSVDGRRIADVRSSPFATRVRARPGRHRLVARVTFVRASRTAPRVLRLGFAGCAAAPEFTG